MKKTLAEVGDFKIGGSIINKVRFLNLIAIITKTEEGLQGMFNRLLICKEICHGNQHRQITSSESIQKKRITAD